MNGWVFHVLMVMTGAVAGIINALAGGGPILTLGVLTLTGIDPKIANLTSTVALSPGQLAAGFVSRDRLGKLRLGSPILLVIIAAVGGAAGAALLMITVLMSF